jgi:hypothetical protein
MVYFPIHNADKNSQTLSPVKKIYRSVVVIAVDVRSAVGAAGAAPTTGAVAGVWDWAGTRASCLPPTFADAGPVNECSMISIVWMRASKLSLKLLHSSLTTDC